MTHPDALSISYAHALILGIIQGITEFLPVSSTGHMRLIPALLHWQDPGAAFSAVAQLGPIFAIIAYFRKDLAKYIAGMARTLNLQPDATAPEKDVDARIGWLTAIGTIPIIIGGLALEKKIDYDFRSLYYVAVELIVFSILLWIAEVVSKRNRDLKSISLIDAIVIGLAQVFALFPGASRSGTTITAGLFVNLDRETAARFSFLLSIPAITLAGLYKLYKVLKVTHLGHAVVPYLFAAVVAGVIAYVVIAMFLGYISEEGHSTRPFIIYRIALGVALLILLKVGYLQPFSGLPPEPAPSNTAAVAVATHVAPSG